MVESIEDSGSSQRTGVVEKKLKVMLETRINPKKLAKTGIVKFNGWVLDISISQMVPNMLVKLLMGSSME